MAGTGGAGHHSFALKCGAASFRAHGLLRQLQKQTRRHLQAISISKTASQVVFASAAGGSFGDAKKPRSRPFLQDVGKPFRRATDIAIGLNLFFFALQKLSGDLLTIWGCKLTSAIAAGQLWRLITPAFLHSGLVHLLVNMYTLNSVGPHLEEVVGRARFLAVASVGAVTGTTISCLLAPQVISVGSSCAIFGMFAAVGVYHWRHRKVLRRSRAVLNAMGVTLVLNVAMALAIKRLDHWGHIGGTLGGAAAAWLLGPRFEQVREDDSATGLFVDRPPCPVLAFPDPHFIS